VHQTSVNYSTWDREEGGFPFDRVSRLQLTRPERRMESERNEWEKVVAGHAVRKHVGEACRGHIGALEFT